MFKRIRAAKLFAASSNPPAEPAAPALPPRPPPAPQARSPQEQQRAQQAEVWRHRPPPAQYFSSGDSSSTDSSSEDEGRGRQARRRPPRYEPPPAVRRGAEITPQPDRLDYLVPDLVRHCNTAAPQQPESLVSAQVEARAGPVMGQRASSACTHQQRPRQPALNVNPVQVTRKPIAKSGVSLSWAIGQPCNDISKPVVTKYQEKNSKSTWNERLNNKPQNDAVKIRNQPTRKPFLYPISNANTFRNGPFKFKSDHERNNKNEKRSNDQRRRANSNQYTLQESRAISEPALQSDCVSDGTESGRKTTKHRRRRERQKAPGFGYQIRDINDFLTNACLDNPANIPVVLGCSSVLYRTRPGGFQQEIQLPLGMVVNAVFKNRGWLYVQTPHAEEGYISHGSCLPLGILPTEQSRNNTLNGKPAPCWESTGDVFPRPCGNLTDSEKEQLRGGTRSECGGSRQKQRTKRIRRETRSLCRGSAGEGSVDRLFLQAASTTEYALNASKMAQTCKTKPRQEENEIKCLRHTLLAVCEEYSDTRNDLVVNKGDVVVLVTTVRSRDGEQWFHVRDREGKEGLIPAQVAGNGFL